MIEYVNRKGSDSYKWDSDGAKDCLPLSVADMDFKIAPPIQHALQQRLEHWQASLHRKLLEKTN